MLYLRLCFITFLVFSFAGYSQNNIQQMEKMLKEDFDNMKEDNIIKMNSYRFDSTNEKYFLNFFKKYKHETSTNVHIIVLGLKFQIGFYSKDTLIRQEVVEDLLNDCIISPKDVGQIAGKLFFFKPADFSYKAKSLIIDLFNKGYYGSRLLLVIGIAQVKELEIPIKKIASNFDRRKAIWFNTNGWFASLALARLGDTANIDNIIAAVELETEPFTRVSVLLNYIAYTQQRDCFKLLYNYLMSSNRLPAEHGRIGTEYNQFAMEFLSKYIDNFPVKTKGIGSYTKEEIDMAKEYLEKTIE